MKTITVMCGSCQMQHTLEIKNFSGGMVRTLVALCRRYQQAPGWIEAKQMVLSPGDLDKLSLWGFVEQAPPQGRKKKSGMWRPTDSGWNFAIGQITAASSVITEAGRPTGFVNKQVGVQELIKQEELQRLWSA